VWPHDLDAFGHMNNGRYLQIMDVARTDWMARTGVLAAIREHRWSAVLGGGATRYRRSLRLMQKYHVRTQLLHWDDRWFFFEHAFIDPDGRRVAVGISRAALQKSGRWVCTRDVVARIEPEARVPEPPEYLEQWLSLDDAIWDHSEAQIDPIETKLAGAER
jgi:acyl-CoA thioesterase FadM